MSARLEIGDRIRFTDGPTDDGINYIGTIEEIDGTFEQPRYKIVWDDGLNTDGIWFYVRDISPAPINNP